VARYNEILIGRWNRYLQKLCGIKGSPPAPQLASEISATFEIEQPAVESRFLLGWNRFGFGLQITGAAGNPTMVRVRNPTGSGVIAVLESLITYANPNDRLQLTYTAIGTDVTTSQTVIPLDGRSGTSSSSVRVSSSNSTASAGLAVYHDLTMVSAVPLQLITTGSQEIPITPGFAWGAQTLSASVVIGVNIIWRERALEEGELK
jgi:hypothetical protein